MESEIAIEKDISKKVINVTTQKTITAQVQVDAKEILGNVPIQILGDDDSFQVILPAGTSEEDIEILKTKIKNMCALNNRVINIAD